MSEQNGHAAVKNISDVGSASEPLDILASLEATTEELKAERDGLQNELTQTRRERDIYRQLSTIAESNELKLHRKLSEYTDSEMAALRRRNEELEKRVSEASEATRGGE